MSEKFLFDFEIINLNIKEKISAALVKFMLRYFLNSQI